MREEKWNEERKGSTEEDGERERDGALGRFPRGQRREEGPRLKFACPSVGLEMTAIHPHTMNAEDLFSFLASLPRTADITQTS